MAQRVFVRVDCDSHRELFGVDKWEERPIDEGDGKPPFLHEFSWDGIKKLIYCCDECVQRMFGLVFIFVEAKGVEPITRGRAPRTAPVPQARALPSTPPPTSTPAKPPSPRTAVPVEATVVPPTPGRPLFTEPATPAPAAVTPETTTPSPHQDELDVDGTSAPSNVVPLETGKYPCPLCPESEPTIYDTTSGVTIHLKHVHHVSSEDLIGTRCHGCGDELHTFKALGAHFGVRHVRLGHSVGRSLVESFVVARANGDPYGTVAAGIQRIGDVRTEAQA